LESNAQDTIYEIDFSNVNSIDELTAKGWKFLNADKCYSVKDGLLYIGSNDTSYVRAILPEELVSYGNYDITVEAKMISSANNSRWFGLVYRIQNYESGKYYPYFHMCVRDNSSATNGVEFAERTSGDSWSVKLTQSTTFDSSKSKFHEYEIKAYDKSIQYLIDGEQSIYCTSESFNQTGKYLKGGLGITADACVIAVKKITVKTQTEVPEKAQKKIELLNIGHDITKLINPIANVQKIIGDELVNGIEEAYVSYSDIKDINAFIGNCVEKVIIPVIKLDNEDQVTALKAAVNDSNLKDIVVVSENSEVLNKARKNFKRISCGRGLILNNVASSLTSADANEIRKTVQNADATFCILNESACNKDSISKIQKLCIAVWADVTASSNENVSYAKVLTAGVNGVISNSSSNLAEFANNNFADFTMTRLPLDIGHRGSANEAMENSIASYKKAIAGGADTVETDVYLSADGVCVVNHDGTINRTTNYTGSKRVTELTLEEIKKYKIKNLDGTLSDETTPTFDEMLKALKDDDVFIFIELKESTSALCKEVARIISENGFEDRVCCITFNASTITYMKKALPGMSVGYLFMSQGGDAGDMVDALDVLYPQIKLSQAESGTYNPQNTVITHSVIQAATDRGMTVWPWTYNASSNNYGFFVCSDGMTTDDPQWFKNMVNTLTAVLPNQIEEGDSKKIKAKTTTYSGETADVQENLVVKVVDGAEYIKVDGSNIKGVSEGTVTILVGYKTKTTANDEYVVYSDAITISVVSKGTEVDDSEYEDFDEKKTGCGSVVLGGNIVAILLVSTIILKKKNVNLFTRR